METSNTLDLWLKREAETGDGRAMTNYQQGCRHKITDTERFEAFVKQHGGKSQVQLALLWGEGVTPLAYQCSLAKAGHQSKKKTFGYQEGDEFKREAFRAQLKTKSASAIVYVDEAGIDNRDDYPYGYCPIGQRFYALKSGKRTEPVSWSAALGQGNILAPMTFAGSCNKRLI